MASSSRWLSGLALGAALSTSFTATARSEPNYAIGACVVADTNANTSIGSSEISPTVVADTYMIEYQSKSSSPLKKYANDKYSFDEAKTTVTVAPKHGKLTWDTNTGPNISASKEGWYYYTSDKGYSGEDTFVIQVKKYGLAINVYCTVEIPEPNEIGDGSCQMGDHWKISKIDVKDGNGSTSASTYFTPQDPFNAISPLSHRIDTTDPMPGIQINLSNLAGLVVGQESTNGGNRKITLDESAAGHGWFVDSTPTDNSEFLPTANPNEWVAKVGSAAYGKMDMYSVLLHEYGHALGLDHSPDAHDFMAPTLAPGVRRLLS